VRAFVLEHAAGRLDDEGLEDLIQAVDEMSTNVLVHGYRRQPGPLTVEVEHAVGAVVVRIRDEAPIFDPGGAPRPSHLEAPLAARPPGGFGIHLTRGCVDEMHHRARDNGVGGNELTLVKRGGGEGAVT